MSFVAIVVVFLIMMSMPAHNDQASRILPGEKQNLMKKNHFLGSPQALAQVPRVLVPPSAPNPSTHIPSLRWSQRKCPPPHPSMLHRADVTLSAPNSGTYIPSSTRSQRMSPFPHPSMLHKAYNVLPPNPGTHVWCPSFNNQTQSCTIARITAQESSASHYGQWGHLHPLALYMCLDLLFYISIICTSIFSPPNKLH